MRVPFEGSGQTQGRTQGNSNGRRNGPTPPSSSKGKKSKPVKPDWIVKLEIEATAEELKARIRTAQKQGRMMSQGISYLLVAEQSSTRPHTPVHTPHDPDVHAPPPLPSAGSAGHRHGRCDRTDREYPCSAKTGAPVDPKTGLRMSLWSPGRLGRQHKEL
jgi:hypothetical protein